MHRESGQLIYCTLRQYNNLEQALSWHWCTRRRFDISRQTAKRWYLQLAGGYSAYRTIRRVHAFRSCEMRKEAFIIYCKSYRHNLRSHFRRLFQSVIVSQPVGTVARRWQRTLTSVNDREKKPQNKPGECTTLFYYHRGVILINIRSILLQLLKSWYFENKILCKYNTGVEHCYTTTVEFNFSSSVKW